MPFDLAIPATRAVQSALLSSCTVENVSSELTRREPQRGKFLLYVDKIQAEHAASLCSSVYCPELSPSQPSQQPRSLAIAALSSTQPPQSPTQAPTSTSPASPPQIPAHGTPPRRQPSLRKSRASRKRAQSSHHILRSVRSRVETSRVASSDSDVEVMSDAATQELHQTASLSQIDVRPGVDELLVDDSMPASSDTSSVGDDEQAERAPSRTSARRASNATGQRKPTLYSYCRWRWWSRYLEHSDTRPENVAFQEFGTMTADKQAQCDTDDGIARYGDLCERHAKALFGVFVAKSTVRSGGFGLFTSWQRVKGERICEYTGIIRRQSNDDTYEHATGAHSGKYALDLGTQPTSFGYSVNSHFVLDAPRSTDGFARFANDFAKGSADLKRQCNCVFRAGDDLARQKQDWRLMFLESQAVIAAGSELSAWYGEPYWCIARG